MPEQKLSTLLEGFAEVANSIDRTVRGLSEDSRNIKPGTLFFARRGTQQDGTRYIGAAKEAGAVAIIVERSDLDGNTSLEGIQNDEFPILEVDNIQKCMGTIANRYYQCPSKNLSIYAVTGTNGKTSVSSYIAEALQLITSEPVGVIGTVGVGLFGDLKDSEITTPGILDSHERMYEFSALGVRNITMEASSHALDQNRLNGLYLDTAIFTNLSHDHLDYHKDLQTYEHAKSLLFRWPDIKFAAINADDKVGLRYKQVLSNDVECLTYSLYGQGDVNAVVTQSNLEGIDMLVNVGGKEITLNSKLIGQFNCENLLAAMCALLLNGYELEQITIALSQVNAVAGRMQRIVSHVDDAIKNNDADDTSLPTVIVDYAHTPDALALSLRTLHRRSSGKLWLVFGCGGDRDQGKRPQMGVIASRLADKIVLTDDNPRHEDGDQIIEDIRSGIETNKHTIWVERDRVRAIEFAVSSAESDDIVLIAGKGHENVQIVGDNRLPMDDAMIAMQAQSRRET